MFRSKIVFADQRESKCFIFKPKSYNSSYCVCNFARIFLITRERARAVQPKCGQRSLHIPPLGRGPSLRVGGELSNLSRISSKPKMGNSEPGIHVILWPEASLGRSLSRYGCTILENPSPEIILVHSSPIPQWHAPYTVVCQ